MATINLLTIHYGKCYGAVMQTYATCKLLEKYGHKVTVINLINPNCKFANSYNKLRKCADLYREFQFWYFKKVYFPKMTSKMFNIELDKIPDADITIVGSDQVWNRDITDIFGLTFFLDYLPINRKRIAFASSFGKSEWIETKEYTSKVNDLISKFQAIAVRESSGVKICSDVFNKHALQILDPTLIYGDFDNLVEKKKNPKGVFSFIFHNDSEIPKIKIFISDILQEPLIEKRGLISKFNNGPLNWLSDIYNSNFVITSSFHGLAFSIIFKKDFIILCSDKEKFARIESLLDLLGLQDRYISSYSDLLKRQELITKNIDYDSVYSILDHERNKAFDFLKSIN